MTDCTQLHGLRVRLERARDMKDNYCTSLAVIRIDDTTNKAELRCALCGRYRGRLSARMAQWLLVLLKHFPVAKEQPLIIRDATHGFENPDDEINDGADHHNSWRGGSRQDNIGRALS